MSIFNLRLLIGILQGSVLAFLFAANREPLYWPATQPAIDLPLVLAIVFVPLLIVQGIGNLRNKTLSVWVGTATVILSGLAYYAVFHQALPELAFENSPELFCSTFIALFIAHSLVLAGDNDRALIARYPTYFDIAWKLGIQAIFTAAFVGCFWLLLVLGSGLFNSIHLNFFESIVTNRWFSIPATTIAAAIALHITDIKVDLISGIRALILVLLSSLLPIITCIVSLFLFSLFFTGISLLWKTGFASNLLLVAATALIILINASYQNGNYPLSAAKQFFVKLACCLLTPLIALAIYALGLRVEQYGWSISRIFAATYMLVVAVYACGYFPSIFKTTAQYKLLEKCNIFVAFLVPAIYLALMSPIADPVRISVNSQLSRLQTGKISPEKFDYKTLRVKGMRFGDNALKELQDNWQGPQKNLVQSEAKAALAIKLKFHYLKDTVTPEARSKLIILHPENAKLPDSFLRQKWDLNKDWRLPGCLTRGSESCHAFMTEGKDKSAMILIFDKARFTGFQQDKDVWSVTGYWTIPGACTAKMEAAKQGKFSLVKPEPLQSDIEIMGWRARFEPKDEGKYSCK